MESPHPAIEHLIDPEGASVIAAPEMEESSVIPVRQVMDAEDAADYLRLTQDALEGWRRRGHGPPYAKDKRTKRVWYLKEDLDEWLRSLRVNPGEK